MGLVCQATIFHVNNAMSSDKPLRVYRNIQNPIIVRDQQS
jgi:hypothetical protein